jgi:alpha-tubulin suppressor-like RCC1 family protein
MISLHCPAGVLVVICIFATACSHDATITPPNPSAPAINTVSPGSASVGGPAFTLIVTGTGFVAGSVVLWNGVSRETAYTSSTQLSAQILASDIAFVGAPRVGVKNPSGDTAQTKAFPITTGSVATPRRTVIAAGGDYTCALSAAGQLYCWSDSYSRIFAGRAGAVPKSVLSTVVIQSVSVSLDHPGYTSFGCAVTTGGTIWCWGDDLYGQLGNGKQRLGFEEFAPVRSEVVFKTVAAGRSHVCALSVAGKAYCWGDDFSGELGDERHGEPGQGGAESSVPIEVHTSLAFVAIGSGDGYSCALTEQGLAYCWGSSGGGVLGNGERVAGVPPARGVGPVAGAHVFSTISVGHAHTCALTPDGEAYCWGGNLYGEAGSPGYDALEPRSVSGGHTFASISAGYQHTCAVARDNTAYCWGDNAVGQLGNSEIRLAACRFGPVCEPVPIAVAGGAVFASISAGISHTCAITISGAARCWGSRDDGALGDGLTSVRTRAYAVAGNLKMRQIAEGSAVCALTTAGQVYCWGSNDLGQLGIGANSGPETCGVLSSSAVLYCSSRPVSVVGAEGLMFKSIAAGSSHVCALATNFSAYCWGSWGRTTSSPVQASANLLLDTIAAAAYYTCGISTDRAAFCWGRGPLGNDIDISSSASVVPTAVSGGLSFSSISAGNEHVCALTLAGIAYCWGRNTYGQLGNGNRTNINRPVAVFGNLTFSSISSGSKHTCGQTTSGTLYCWGANYEGELGTPGTEVCRVVLNPGFTENVQCSPKPTPVPASLAFRSVIAGGFGTCAFTLDNALYCWGRYPDPTLPNFGSMQARNFSDFTFAWFGWRCGITTTNAGYCWGNSRFGQVGDGFLDYSTVPVDVLGNIHFALP